VEISSKKFHLSKRKPWLALFYLICSLGVLKFLYAVYTEQEGDLSISYMMFFFTTSSIFLLSTIHQVFNNQVLEIKEADLIIKNWFIVFRFKKKIKLQSIKKIRLLKAKKGQRSGDEIGFNAGLWQKDYSIGDFRTITLSLEGKTHTYALAEQLKKEKSMLIIESIQEQIEQLTRQ
tara:strand:+ start:1813 stop:2340 length:528 start_codon:yes stop_codon:yes gene_type:complete